MGKVSAATIQTPPGWKAQLHLWRADSNVERSQLWLQSTKRFNLFASEREPLNAVSEQGAFQTMLPLLNNTIESEIHNICPYYSRLDAAAWWFGAWYSQNDPQCMRCWERSLSGSIPCGNLSSPMKLPWTILRSRRQLNPAQYGRQQMDRWVTCEDK